VYFNFFLIDIFILVSIYVLTISTSVHIEIDFVNNPQNFQPWVRITYSTWAASCARITYSCSPDMSGSPEGASETHVNSFFSLTNLDRMQDVSADHGHPLLQQHVRGHNP
jgi:hypothetical protein